MAELAIRVARAADLAAATSLLRAAGLPVEDFSEDLIGNFLVASTGPSVVGCIGLEPLSNVGLLRSLAVDPDFRDGGVGRMLVGALEAHASRRGINELWLLTIDADGFFSRLDYRVQERDKAPAAIRRTAEFSLLCPDDAILMKKTI
ncbi:MAG: arsenic resistance N-acetyltransferase ArsN2 [Gammaproteobacteria bacterium]|jgi:amino-acid N-acetyltransferase|nr:arsenic resistance N-acetyltransferase ArsN2 [Gammaproteobacteria bacterium]MDH3906626.1 arsenic resistance N-acetyltransferase ArsN2 [Gammaproteobacteria bacterium]MDH3907761.1 arsenic resistance N-acetyltransferase ArsN2 [Gammaproteobacteria bacterium]MDH4003266.1 arsenic resistance N-acetyltransferase ArsN2 [Gammaproteobacteria bacterium]